MASVFIFICLFGLYPSIALETKDSSHISVNNKTLLETYIVHVTLPHTKSNFLRPQELESWYYSFLPPTIAHSHHRTRMLHCYHNAITGFAARLSPEEIKSLAKKDGFVSASPEKVLFLHTTRSPTFLGLQQKAGIWKDSNYGKGIIIGVLDTGITPNHPSFSGHGVPPPPARWKGKCDLSGTACNNKLIGARNFIDGDAPVDKNGHGTHTASTVAGNRVTGSNVSGQAIGTASGIAPLAHLASYKVCSQSSCSESDILAGIDTAIADGVDVLSISLGAGSSPFHASNLAIGTLAFLRRIFVMRRGCLQPNDVSEGGEENIYLHTSNINSNELVSLACFAPIYPHHCLS